MTAPNIYLAVAHGVTAQLFFSLLVAVAVVTPRPGGRISRRKSRLGGERAAPGLDRARCCDPQIVFGAIQRHLAIG